VQAVIVNPQDPTMVYTGGDSSGVYRSTDCGATWTHVNESESGKMLNPGRTWCMAIDPVVPTTLWTVAGYGNNGLWKTTDGGVNWTRIWGPDSDVAKYVPDTFASVFSLDPTDHQHVVVSFHTQCLGPYAGGCEAETKDGGATWKLIKSPDGGEGAGPIVLGPKEWLYVLPLGGIYRTADGGDTFQKLDGVNGGHWQIYRSKDGTYYMGTPNGIGTSKDGEHWSVIPNSGGNLQGIVGTGKTIYASQQNGGLFFSAPEDDPTKWKQIDTPGMPLTDDGAYLMAYDPDHHILYASRTQSGLWRMVTE
jgi:photosystem II stability/assembly factor-like uncharacterized protein